MSRSFLLGVLGVWCAGAAVAIGCGSDAAQNPIPDAGTPDAAPVDAAPADAAPDGNTKDGGADGGGDGGVSVWKPNKIAAGANHTCAVTALNHVDCWGHNSSAQIAQPTSTSLFWSPTPVVLPGGDEAVDAVAAGGNSSGSSCAVTVSGKLWCWGGVVALSATPILIPSAAAVLGVAVGDTHACFIAAPDTVHCWGNNSVGQLGDGTNNPQSSSTPVLVPDHLGITPLHAIALAANLTQTCAILLDGSVTCWGNNTLLATAVTGVSNVNALALTAGPRAVQSDGTLWGWTATVATQVAGVTGVARLASGTQHWCATDSIGDVRCWGTGLMGNGNVSETQTTPTAVGGLHTVGALAAGFQHTCALRTDGSMACWGAGGFGQIGQGDTAPRNTPSDVPTVVFWH